MVRPPRPRSPPPLPPYFLHLIAQDNEERARSKSQSQNSTHGRRRDTAWLDGLRGYAAVLVLICHFVFAYNHSIALAWGTTLPLGTIVPNGTWISEGIPVWNGTRIDRAAAAEQENYGLIQLPIIRLLTFGDPMVVIFFLVSGYALSIKPLGLIRRGASSHSQLLVALSSSFIRRPIRLLVPVLASTLIVLVATNIGLYSYAATFANNSTTFHRYFKGWAFEATPKVAPSLYLQIVDWFYSMYDLLDFFTHFHWTMSRYDIHLWTIPVELRCSVFLFMTHAATALMTSKTRLASLTVFATLGITWGDSWEMSLFWTGIAMCELDMMHPATSHHDRYHKRWIALFVLGLYLMSTPMLFAQYSPCFSGLAQVHIPGLRKSEQPRFWQCAGAVMVLLTVSHCQTFKNFFSNRLARYLGRISYALYLVHGPILRCVGYSLSFWLWQVIGRETPFQYNAVVVITAIVVFPTIFLAADFFCKRVDEPVVVFARWMDAMLRAPGLPPPEIRITRETRRSDEGKRYARSSSRSPDVLRGLEAGLGGSAGL